MQTSLEIKALEKKQELIVKNDYSEIDEYNANHKDALSDGDPQGKGTGHGGHTHYIPNHNLPQTSYNYSNLDTTGGGGSYDINGRNGIGGRVFLQNISLYNEAYQYGRDANPTVTNGTITRI